MKKNAVFLFCCIAIFLATSCTEQPRNSETESTKTSPKEESKQEVEQVETFPPHQAFYTNLLSRSSCEDLTSIPATITGPVNCSEFKTSIEEFGRRYSANGPLDYFPTKISIDSTNNELIDLFKSIASEDRYGLVFHYGYEETTTGDKIVYILSRGTLEDSTGVQYCPFPSGENNQDTPHFLLLEPDGNKPFKAIDQTQFNAYTEKYFQEMRYDSNPLLLNTHSKMVYHEPDSLVRFYDAFSSFSDLHLYINHGSVPSKSNSMVYHAPILSMGDQNIFYEIDDTPSAPNVFVKKALDIGQLCPPNCGLVVTPGPDC